MNICVRFLAFEGVTRLSARVFLEYIFCCFEEKSAGQFAIEKFSFLSYGFFFSGLLAIAEWHILEYDLGNWFLC